MDATGTERAICVSWSMGTLWNLVLCATEPERVSAAVFIASLFPVVGPMPDWATVDVHTRREEYRGAERYNRHYILEQYRDFVTWWGERGVAEPHSTMQREDVVTWALQTTPETIINTLGPIDAPGVNTVSDLFEQIGGGLHALAARVQCPAFVIHGDLDDLTPRHWGKALAEATGGELLVLPHVGHSPPGRWPVAVNHMLRDVAEPDAERDPTVHRTDGRKRALFVSSPIGLGHSQRDVAIAKELRKLEPDLQIDWLAQDPVTRVLEAEGETIHPESVHLASESGHFQAESSEHDLHCFQAYRRMDEILVANFMLFHDVVTNERYDLWIADEGWEVDHFLHEHPELKRAPFAWLTDFVGFLPMPDGGEHEAFLTADYNAEMVAHVADHPQVRDRSIFIGNPDDIVNEPLGPKLPSIREWTEQHFDFAGYISEFDPAQLGDRDALRAELGYGPDEQVCIATVGGSGIGEALLRRVIDAYPLAKEQVPELRMIVVAGPRIDPASLPSADGLEVQPYVHNLYRHLTACDMAIVQGGLGTTMELTASARPFLYFPLNHHFEQQFHVDHRLRRYGAGRRMEYDESPPAAIAAAIAQEIGRAVDYRPVETDGARKAAARIAELL